MARDFKELRDKMSPAARERVEKKVAQAIRDMPLDQLRKARKLTQVAMAERLNVDQGSISKLESRTDPHISTLREYVEALGGKLEVRAAFPDGTFNNLDI